MGSQRCCDRYRLLTSSVVDSDPIWTRLVVLIPLSTVLLSVLPVAAHSTTDLDEWVNEWETTMTFNISLSVIGHWTEMATRHPRYFGRVLIPIHKEHTTVNKTTGKVEQWRPLVATYFRPSDVDRALRIMACESQGNPRADNPRSTARGLFQILKSWSLHFGYSYADLYDPEINILIAKRIYDIQGWRAWAVYPRCQ